MKNKKITYQDIELGQMAFGNPVGQFKCPEYVEAMVAYILNEIERIYWNKNQKEWDRNEDPKIKGIEYCPYYWGENKKEARELNFSFGEVGLRWYKYFGRSMTLNVSKNEKEWRVWFDACLDHIRKQEPHF